MATKLTSRATLDAGSLGRFPLKEGVELQFGNLKREAVMGDDGVLGYSEKYESAPSVKGTIIHAKNTDEDKIKHFVGEHITVETNSGKSYTLKNAWIGDPLTLSVKDGQIEVLFYGEELISH